MASGAAVTAGTGLMPRRAKAAGELTVWWTQGFYKAENDAVIAWMADWEKRNNTKVNLTIMNGPDVITKLIAGMQVGDVPDVVHTVTGDRFLVPRAAWNDQLEDVSDVVESQKAEFTETALISARLYNAKQKKYSYYGVPTKALLADEFGLAPVAGGSRLCRDRHAGHAGQILRFFPDRAGQAALQGQAYFRPRLFDGGEGGGCRQSVPPVPGQLWRRRHRHCRTAS